jgi:hypothetical protein
MAIIQAYHHALTITTKERQKWLFACQATYYPTTCCTISHLSDRTIINGNTPRLATEGMSAMGSLDFNSGYSFDERLMRLSAGRDVIHSVLHWRGI